MWTSSRKGIDEISPQTEAVEGIDELHSFTLTHPSTTQRAIWILEILDEEIRSVFQVI